MTTLSFDYGVVISDAKVLKLGDETIYDYSWLTVKIGGQTFYLKKQTCVLEVQYSALENISDTVILSGQLPNTSLGQQNINKPLAITKAGVSVAVLYNQLLTMLASTMNTSSIVGEIRAFASTISVPSNFLICDGRELNEADYPDLANAIGIIYGQGSSTGKFKIPDTRLKGLIHADMTNLQIGQELDGKITDDQLPAVSVSVDLPQTSDTTDILQLASPPNQKAHYQPSLGIVLAICYK